MSCRLGTAAHTKGPTPAGPAPGTFCDRSGYLGLLLLITGAPDSLHSWYEPS